MRNGKKTDAGRAELERLAKLDNRLGTRARVALALGEGAAPAAVVARLGVTFTTVRAVRRRLEHGGVAALKEERTRRAQRKRKEQFHPEARRGGWRGEFLM